MRLFIRLCPAILSLIVCLSAHAAEKPIKVKPSKVSAAKGHEREKLFSPWMTEQEIKTLDEAKRAGGEQLIYFEYNQGKKAYRAIFTKDIKFDGYWWYTKSSAASMEEEASGQRKRGFAPVFVVLDGPYYTMLFAKPENIQPAQEFLKGLGIEPPVVK